MSVHRAGGGPAVTAAVTVTSLTADVTPPLGFVYAILVTMETTATNLVMQAPTASAAE